MKSIKDLKIKTKEGIEIKNLQRFPSMEWGEEGGLAADVYLNKEYIGHLHQSGDGGCASFSGYTREGYNKIAEAGMAFLTRVDKDYGPEGRFSWLRNKDVNKFQDDDLETVIIHIEERYDDIKEAKKEFKNGYKAMAVISNDYERRYLFYRVNDITTKEVRKHMLERGLDKKYSDVQIITCNDDLTIL